MKNEPGDWLILIFFLDLDKLLPFGWSDLDFCLVPCWALGDFDTHVLYSIKNFNPFQAYFWRRSSG